MKHVTGLESVQEVANLVGTREEVYLSASALRSFLKAAIENGLTTGEIQQISDLLECENIDYEDTKSGIIAEILFQISSTEINGDIDGEQYRKFIDDLA